MTRDLMFALTGAVLFVTLAVLLFVFGGHATRSVVSISLLCGAVSQFIAQDPDPRAQQVALILSYVGIGLAALSILTFVVT